MSPQVSDKKFATKDRSLVILLIYNKVRIIEAVLDENDHKTVFYFDNEEAKPYLEQWQSITPISVEYRGLIQAEQTFNSLVHSVKSRHEAR